MLRTAVVMMVAVGLLGCGGARPHPRTMLDQEMFGPASIRIHPTFTQPRDWTGDGKLDGIEATLEVQDAFGEPTRATGRVMFELYDYERSSPDVRGRRIGGPWIEFLNTRDQQQARWNAALRAYTFQLPFPNIRSNRHYVLTVQFDLNGDGPTTQPGGAPTTQSAGRMFDRLVIEPENEDTRHAHPHAPNRNPGH